MSSLAALTTITLQDPSSVRFTTTAIFVRRYEPVNLGMMMQQLPKILDSLSNVLSVTNVSCASKIKL